MVTLCWLVDDESPTGLQKGISHQWDSTTSPWLPKAKSPKRSRKLTAVHFPWCSVGSFLLRQETLADSSISEGFSEKTTTETHGLAGSWSLIAVEEAIRMLTVHSLCTLGPTLWSYHCFGFSRWGNRRITSFNMRNMQDGCTQTGPADNPLHSGAIF